MVLADLNLQEKARFFKTRCRLENKKSVPSDPSQNTLRIAAAALQLALLTSG
jgi:hypothetical protein